MQVAVVCFNAGPLSERLAAAGVAVTVLDEQRLTPAGLLLRLSRLFRQKQATIVQSHGFKEHVLAALAAWPLPGCHCLRMIHGDTEPHRQSLRRRLVQTLDLWVGLRLQPVWIAVSHDLAQRVQDRQRAISVGDGLVGHRGDAFVKQRLENFARAG